MEPEPFTAAQMDRLASGGGDSRQILDDLIEVLLEHVGDNTRQQSQEIREVFRIAESSPEILAAMLRRFATVHAQIAPLVAGRLKEAADREDLAALITAVALTAMENGMRRWAQREDDPAIAEARRSFDLLRTLMAGPPR